MKKIWSVLLVCLFIVSAEAHNFKVGDIWYYNEGGISVESKVSQVNKKGVLLVGKYKNQDFHLDISIRSEKIIDVKMIMKSEVGKIDTYDLIDQEYISKKRNTAISRKPINTSEIYINKFLTLKRGTVLYIPVPRKLKRFPILKNYDLLKFNIEECHKLEGHCTAFIDFEDNRIITTIYTPVIDIYNQMEKVIFLDMSVMINDKDISWEGAYYDIANYLYGTQYDEYFFSHGTKKQKGKIFTSWSHENPLVWFELEKGEIDELIDKNKKAGTGQKIIYSYFSYFPKNKKNKILSE